jgi:LEA14-like dessication related protein
MKFLKTVGILAVVGFAISHITGNIVGKIGVGFSSFKFIDFWDNLKRFKLKWVVTLTVENYNDFSITVLGFDGLLKFRDQKLSDIQLAHTVELPSNVRQAIKFGGESSILEGIARIFILFKDKGAEPIRGSIEGSVRVEVKGVAATIPYDQEMGLDY